ncbi:MAG: hypothetical protein NT175_03785 [Bacteroidetes bacterium]|nr:hypothetical protein [Bacteroidota bacterium]
MIKLRFLSLLATICLSSLFCRAQFARQQANDLVLNQIFSDQLNMVDVYTSPDIQTSQNNIILYDSSTINIPTAECWVYFIDDLPFANWNHPCKYIFVNTADGSYTIINSNKYPIDWQNIYNSISLAPRTEPVEMQPNQNAVINGLPPNPHIKIISLLVNISLTIYNFLIMKQSTLIRSI